MILSFIEISATKGNREKISELLRFVIERLEIRTGCLGAGVYLADDESRTILYLERWGSEEEFRRYVRSDLYLSVLNALDLAQELPRISFHEVSETKSLEFIEELRSSDQGLQPEKGHIEDGSIASLRKRNSLPVKRNASRSSRFERPS